MVHYDIFYAIEKKTEIKHLIPYPVLFDSRGWPNNPVNSK